MKSSRSRGTRGFSSIVGAIFMVLIMWVLASSYFVYTLLQNTTYNGAVGQMNQLDNNRMNEQVYGYNATFKVYSDDNVQVYADIVNSGPISTYLTTIWVYASNASTSWKGYNFFTFQASLPAGGILTIKVNVTIQGVASANAQFSSWLVTSRGNIVSLQPPALTSTQVQSMIAQGIGSVQMYFRNFTWYSDPQIGTPIGTGSNTFTVPSNQQLMFGVLLTNLDPSGQDINLTSLSYIWVPCPQSESMKSDRWNIANVTNGIYYASFSPSSACIPLKNGVQTRVYFGPAKPVRTAGEGPLPINIALFGKLGTSDYGQNLPYVVVLFS